VKVKNLIVGCGFSGASLANRIAEELKQEVLVIDAKAHIGGNCYDYKDENGIYIHKYGTHIFHTDLKEIWDFVSRFTKWYPYQHKVRGFIDGTDVPIPFNLNSISLLFPKSIAKKLESKLIEKFGLNVKVPILKLRESKDEDLKFLADYIYEKVFLNYTLKQWGGKPEDLDESVTNRVPIYVGKDDRYFQNRYQGIPLDGFTKLIEKMLDNPLIKVELNTKFEDIKNTISYDRLFYTGAIDEFFGYKLGELPYRSIELDFIEFDREYFQSAAVINYPNNYDFTRIGEYKYFLDTKSKKTVVSFEYPKAFKIGENERYYPIIKDENIELYDSYKQEVKKLKGVYFLGRLGDYKYYDMDKAIERSLKLFEGIKSEL
jgi:UDP-galactopyranose mutase